MKKLKNLFMSAVIGGACLAACHNSVFAADPVKYDISQHGAIADGKTMNTKAIQAAIDELAAKGGGTLVIPKGQFLSGALFLKPGVNLELLEGAVLKGSTNPDDFPTKPAMRFEGHFEQTPWCTSLINADKIDHLRITGPGTLDGNGAAYWNLKTPAGQVSTGRPRIFSIRDCNDVTVSNIHCVNSPSWNLHLYDCKDVTVENSRFEITAKKGPSTDGTDVDSCQNVTIRGCSYSVDDDCICIKGNRFDGLDQSPASPADDHIHITDCTFEKGMGALSLGTEATHIQNIEFDHSTVKGTIPMLRVKMRPDTPGQDYENVNIHDITLNGTGKILSFELTHGTKAEPKPPRAIIKNFTISDIKGSFGAMGTVGGNANTDISNITLKNFNVKVRTATLGATGVTGLTAENMIVNDKPMTLAELTAE